MTMTMTIVTTLLSLRRRISSSSSSSHSQWKSKPNAILTASQQSRRLPLPLPLRRPLTTTTTTAGAAGAGADAPVVAAVVVPEVPTAPTAPATASTAPATAPATTAAAAAAASTASSSSSAAAAAAAVTDAREWLQLLATMVHPTSASDAVERAASQLIERITASSIESLRELVALVRKDALVLPRMSVLLADARNEVNISICKLIYELYKRRERESTRLILQFLPALLWAYLSLSSSGDSKSIHAFEACLVAIYNTEIADYDGEPITQTFTLPSLSRPSVYHDPAPGSTQKLTESALYQHEHSTKPQTVRKPLQSVSSITQAVYTPVLSLLLSRYHAHIGILPASSVLEMCQLICRACFDGYQISASERQELLSSIGAGQESQLPQMVQLSQLGSAFNARLAEASAGRATPAVIARIDLDHYILLEMLHIVTYALYQPATRQVAQVALVDLHLRASAALLFEPLLVSSAAIKALRSSAVRPDASSAVTTRSALLWRPAFVDNVDF
ncbi:hypothetical protein CAOG_05611 [Capsaspora owczarzaki ATCC 30864]|uniref:Hyccin n=1 Tax=Capsaspora owczarzaki (strain ATCC 30864) TaxID=595528 RepID=A0A0D2WTU1_CAPO3|nr:hypothetical protein CAOG_05611 [Capsaspora owczarzaki ATCC 30864]KJE95128.1 hypothetical protein, variant [Capsaspora owczarzaki ATCC 30864]|eukprot:XP_004346284.2 hypothetical protein CAOG_05611 [Capsaspora owczarzaki ATCC 30864]